MAREDRQPAASIITPNTSERRLWSSFLPATGTGVGLGYPHISHTLRPTILHIYREGHGNERDGVMR